MDSESYKNGSTLFGGGQPFFGSTHSTGPELLGAIPSTHSISKPSVISSARRTHAPPLPAYQPAQYLNTTDEYLPPPPIVELEEDDESPDQKAEWRDARWEQLLPQHVDVIFERFVRRLENAEGGAQQVLRWVYRFANTFGRG